MYASVEEWRAEARQPLAEWIALRHHMAALEAQSAGLLAEAVDAYRWPEELPLPERCDSFQAATIQGEKFAEDLTSEIAITLKSSVGAAEQLVGDIIRLQSRLPRCWAKVTTGEADLWQARKIVEACTTIPATSGQSLPAAGLEGLPGTGGESQPGTGGKGQPDPCADVAETDANAGADDGAGAGVDDGVGTSADASADATSAGAETGLDGGAATGVDAAVSAGAETGAGVGVSAVWAVVDSLVSPSLGVVGPRRFFTTLDAAVLTVDPERHQRFRRRQPDRFVRTGPVKDDPATSWVYARLDPADVIYLEATTQLLADLHATHGDTRSNDARRATAFGQLGNPAAIVQTLGVHTTRGLDPVPETEGDTQAIVNQAARLAPLFTPRTQVYVHLVPDALTDPDTITRVEQFGPVLASQVAALTRGSRIRVTPVVHVDGVGITVDQYEIPARIREHVLLAHPQECFPYSSRESRHLDLDHIRPYTDEDREQTDLSVCRGRGRCCRSEATTHTPGTPGQTSPSNLAPLSRRAHRLKTHAGWQYDQPNPGTYLWQS
ncbi:MAG: 13E12 repeat family protein, partial [Propionibacteriaceae bacterium]|nr:13E12 repeat family protein [Propionibacteriaceae bacterium]